MHGAFINKGIDNIRISSIINKSDIINLLASTDLKIKEKIPVLICSLGNTIINKILNCKVLITFLISQTDNVPILHHPRRSSIYTNNW